MNEPNAPQPSSDPSASSPVTEPSALASMDGMWERLKHHKVIQWTLAYAAGAYTLLHGVQMLSEALQWPHAIARILSLVLLLGVPVAATVAWYHGAKAQHRVSGPELTIITLLLIIAAAVLWAIGRTPSEHERAVAGAGAETNPAVAAPAVKISDKSIAVLPFVNMSSDKEQEYFSDGLSEQLIDLLVKVPGLYVPARTSSFYFKGKQTTVADIAKALGVAHVLEGSVRKSGNTLRITAQLIRADNGYHLWSETYDRQLSDIFKVQDEIAAVVVDALKVSLLGAAAPKSAATENLDAYTLYLKGRTLYGSGNGQKDDERAVEYLRQAVKLDPEFAPAWAKLANAIVGNAVWWSAIVSPQAAAEARGAAEQAIRLGPKLGDAHFAMARLLHQVEWNVPAAAAEMKQGLALEPDNAYGLMMASELAWTEGRADEALRLAKLSVARDPLYAWAYWRLSLSLITLGRHAEAETAARRGLALSPTADSLHFLVAYTLLARGEPAAALTELQKETSAFYRAAGLPSVLEALGRKQEAEKALAVLESMGAPTSVTIAQFYAQRKDYDRGFMWLERAVRDRVFNVIYLKAFPEFAGLRSDPRYKALLRKLNLPE